MNVVDSSAWLSYFADDANAELFSTPIPYSSVVFPLIISLAKRADEAGRAPS